MASTNALELQTRGMFFGMLCCDPQTGSLLEQNLTTRHVARAESETRLDIQFGRRSSAVRKIEGGNMLQKMPY